MNTIKKILELIKKGDFSESAIRDLIEKEIKSDRKRLLKALSEETAYMYDDIFDKVKIQLTK